MGSVLKDRVSDLSGYTIRVLPCSIWVREWKEGYWLGPQTYKWSEWLQNSCIDMYDRCGRSCFWGFDSFCDVGKKSYVHAKGNCRNSAGHTKYTNEKSVSPSLSRALSFIQLTLEILWRVEILIENWWQFLWCSLLLLHPTSLNGSSRHASPSFFLHNNKTNKPQTELLNSNT